MEGWRNFVDVPVSNRRATTLANENKEPFSVLTENAFSWKAVRNSRARDLIRDRGLQGIRPLQGLLSLSRQHRVADLENACKVASSHQAYRLAMAEIRWRQPGVRPARPIPP